MNISRWHLFHICLCFVVGFLSYFDIIPFLDFGLFLAIEVNLIILPEWFAFIASLMAVRGRPQLAMQLINAGMVVDRENYRLTCARALAYQQIGDLESALEDATTALELSHNNNYAMNMRGVVHLSLSDYLEAEADYNLLLKTNPEDTVALLNRACARLQLGKTEDCLADCERVLRSTKYRENAQFIKVAALLEQRKLVEAEQVVKLMENSKSKHHLILLSQAMLKGSQNKFEEVLALCAVAPADRKAEYFLSPQANAYLCLNEGDLALSTASLVVAKYPHSFSGYCHRALALIETGYWQEAIADCNMVETLQPHLSIAYVLRARVCLAVGDYEQCLEQAEKGLSKNRFDTGAYFMKVAALCYFKRYEEARAAAKEALDINPQDTYALMATAQVALESETADQALGFLDRAIVVDPHLRNAYKMRSEEQTALGNVDRAQADLQRFQSMQTQLIAGVKERVLLLQQERTEDPLEYLGAYMAE